MFKGSLRPRRLLEARSGPLTLRLLPRQVVINRNAALSQMRCRLLLRYHHSSEKQGQRNANSDDQLYGRRSGIKS